MKDVSLESKMEKDEYVVETKKTKIAHKCQVLVVGGGPSGLSAAIAASRAGAQTMII